MLSKTRPSIHPPPSLLKLESVSIDYGAVRAVHEVSLTLERGKILTLIGANGAGKTTTLKCISGLVRPSQGQILFKGKPIHTMAAHEIVRQRICQAPEGRGIFLNLTVEENLDLGAWTLKSNPRTDLEHSFELFPRLKERRKQSAGTLSGGEQQMLSIARALMGRPELLLLDEPSLGLAPQIIEKIFETIQKINREGMTVLLVEQNALQALTIAHEGVVLENGRVKLVGRASELLSSSEVRKAYLGE